MAKTPKKGRQSAGILLYRRHGLDLEVLLAHPGGPHWTHKDNGHWTIPKGEPEPNESNLWLVAKREFAEETGIDLPANAAGLPLGTIEQKGGKIVHAWAVEGDADTAKIQSNTIEIEWPPRSGLSISIPEIDRCEWFSLKAARPKLKETQIPFLDRFAEIIAANQ
jgi:predicted NUDIX family NTP pyrophosphohydrolase